MSESSSYRSIVRSTGIVAGAQLGVLVIGLIRVKLLAVWVGPAGIGLLGILNSLLASASLIAGMGLGTSAVRHIADPEDDIAVVRTAVLGLAVLLGAVGGVAVWLLREPLAFALKGDLSLAGAIGWTGIAVAFTVVASALTAVLQGQRRLGRLAVMQLGGTLAGVVAGVGAVATLGHEGIIVAVIAAPAGLVVVGAWLQRTDGLFGPESVDLRRMAALWQPVLKVGVVIMGTAMISALAQILLRTILLRELGLAQLGLFQAATAILTMNVSLVLTAMATDYFPRLSQVAVDGEASERLLNEQLHVAILASLPILFLLATAPALWLTILYSEAFTPASELMRWLALGEAIRLPIWALGYLMLARRDNLSYVLSESSVAGATLLIAHHLIPKLGLYGAGLGIVAGLAVGLVVTATLAGWRYRLHLRTECMWPFAFLCAALLMLAVIGPAHPGLALIAGAATVVLSGCFAIAVLRRKKALPARINMLIEGAAKLMTRR